MGWSNGSAMATLYGLNRPQIAAAAIYSAPDAFGAFNDPCVQQPMVGQPKDDPELQLLNPQLPIYHMHNDCDIGGVCPTRLHPIGSALGRERECPSVKNRGVGEGLNKKKNNTCV